MSRCPPLPTCTIWPSRATTASQPGQPPVVDVAVEVAVDPRPGAARRSPPARDRPPRRGSWPHPAKDFAKRLWSYSADFDQERQMRLGKVLAAAGAALACLPASAVGAGADREPAVGARGRRRRSCRWATRRSPARPGAGPATRTAPRRARTRPGRRRTTTTPTAPAEAIPGCHRSEVGRGAHRRRRGQRRTSPARARAPTRTSATTARSSPGLDFYSDSSGQARARRSRSRVRGRTTTSRPSWC